MALSQVDICNLALSRAGGHSISQITSLGEASTEARQCAIKFPPLLRACLRSHAWRFAQKETALALLGTCADKEGFAGNAHYGKLFSYQYPEDCVRVLAVNSVQGKKGGFYGESVPYNVENSDDGSKIIVTPCEYAVLSFIAYVDDPGRWDSLFSDAFAWHLAAELCLSLGGDFGRVQALQEMAGKAFEKAKSRDCGESYLPLYSSRYLEARK